MTPSATAAELALQALGITEPEEIDIEVVARSLGAKVKYRPLSTCEARIVGEGGRAIITVDSSTKPRRQRFSIGHELGHWHRHRGLCLACRSADIGRPLSDGRRERPNAELQADAYASDLLLPGYIFRPLAGDIDRLTLDAIKSLADLFQTSMTATAIRALGTNRFPALLVCHSQQECAGFADHRSCLIAGFHARIFSESPAFRILFNSAPDNRRPFQVKASCWFDNPLADRFSVTEQTFQLPGGNVATLVTISNAMLKV